MAEGFGCYGEVVTEPSEIKPALERAKNSGKTAVLDVKIEFIEFLPFCPIFTIILINFRFELSLS